MFFIAAKFSYQVSSSPHSPYCAMSLVTPHQFISSVSLSNNYNSSGNSRNWQRKLSSSGMWRHVLCEKFTILRQFIPVALRTIRIIVNPVNGGPGSIPGQSMWDLWWTKWQWDRFFLEYFGFPLSISFHRCSNTWKSEKKLIIFLFIIIIGLHNKPQGCGASVASAAGL